MRSSRLVTGVVIAILSVSAFGIAADSPADEAKAAYAAGEYGRAAGLANRALQVTDITDDQAYELLGLKAEALMRNKQYSIAARAFDMAATHVDDLPRTAWAKGSATLARACPEGTYLVRGTQERIEIIDPDARKKAMVLMANDIYQIDAREIRRALNANNIDEVVKVLPAVYKMAALEMAGLGNVDRSGPILKDLGKQVRTLATNQLRLISRRVDQYQNLSESYSGWANEGGRRGLRRDEKVALQAVGDQVVRIHRAAMQAQNASERLQGDVATWDSIISETADIMERIDWTLMQKP